MVCTGQKTFEVRKNDRDFKVGDILHLRNYSHPEKEYLYGYALCEVTYILKGGQFGLEEEYVIMGLKVLSSKY